MNKHIFYIAAACVALASCVKNEVRVNAPDKEITFQTVSTKADPNAFDINHKFYSYAYFLEKDKFWDTANLLTDAKAYIDKANIYYHPATPKGYWAAGNTYYWPKQGSLTFFAWTDDTAAPSVGTEPDVKVSCAPNTGIKIENYSVEKNPNKDILVAEIAKDKKSNETAAGTWENGVPTVFRHALAKVEFKVNKKEAYPNVTFKVKSITLNQVSTKGTFKQGSPAEGWKWSGQDTPDDLTVFSSTSTEGTEVTKTAGPATAEFDALTPSTGDYSIVLPQNFDVNSPSKLTIVYDIITSYVVNGEAVTETVEETKALNAIYPNNWECKKKYVLGITLGLNEIYWDPSIVDWDNGTVNDIEI